MLYIIKLVFETINAKFFKSVDGNALSLSYLTAIHPKKKGLFDC